MQEAITTDQNRAQRCVGGMEADAEPDFGHEAISTGKAKDQSAVAGSHGQGPTSGERIWLQDDNRLQGGGHHL